MLRHCSTTTATGPMLPCRQDVAMTLKQEERHRDKQSTTRQYEFHFTSIQRKSSVTYFAVRKTTQHKLPQLKLGSPIYAIGPPVVYRRKTQVSLWGLCNRTFSYSTKEPGSSEIFIQFYTRGSTECH